MGMTGQAEAMDDGPELGRREVWAERTFLVLLLVAGFVLRVWGVTKMHSWDENVYLQHGEILCCGKSNYSELDYRPPLLSLLYAGVFLAWNSSYAAAIVTALLNAMAALWTYLSGRMMAGRAAAAMAALLIGFAPFFVNEGHSLLTDAPALSLIALSFWLLLRALERQTDARFAAAGFALAMCVLMRFGSLSSVGVLGLLALMADRRARAMAACGAGFLVGLGPYLCWSRVRYGGFLATLVNGWNNVGGSTHSPFYYLQRYGEIFSWLSLAGLALWMGRWAWARCGRGEDAWRASGALRKVRGARWLEVYLWLWGAAVLVFFSTLRHSEERYIMPLAPPLFLLAGIGLSVLVKGRRRSARVAGSIVLGCALIYTFLPLRHRMETGLVDHSVSEEMQVSEFLSRTVPAGTVLYANCNYPDFAYYTNLPVVALDESGPDLYVELNALKDGGVLIAYKPEEDCSVVEPSLQWLDSNPHFRRIQEFPSLVVYAYHAQAER
jgi:4-amino-4-deoxy-L-arabinose transferase-like glycosyltransferase